MPDPTPLGSQASSLSPSSLSPGPHPHKGWHSRGYLPHFDQPGLIQGITFRLSDSLPAHVVASLAEDLQETDDPAKQARIEAYLNAGYGACHLREPRIAGLVEDALLYFDGERYRLIAWVIMPSHVHTLIETIEDHPLHRIVHSWKSYTAKQVNQILGRSGRFWFPEYFDRYIRNEHHLEGAIHVTTQPICELTAAYDPNWPKSPFPAIGGHPRYGGAAPYMAFSAIHSGHRRDA